MQYLEQLAGLDWEVDEPRIQSSATSLMSHVIRKEVWFIKSGSWCTTIGAHKLSLKEREMLKIMKSM